MSESFIESLYARCPRCNSKLIHDEDGMEQCEQCRTELQPDWDKYYDEVIEKIIDLGIQSPILVKDWKKRISDCLERSEKDDSK